MPEKQSSSIFVGAWNAVKKVPEWQTAQAMKVYDKYFVPTYTTKKDKEVAQATRKSIAKFVHKGVIGVDAAIIGFGIVKGYSYLKNKQINFKTPEIQPIKTDSQKPKRELRFIKHQEVNIAIQDIKPDTLFVGTLLPKNTRLIDWESDGHVVKAAINSIHKKTGREGRWDVSVGEVSQILAIAAQGLDQKNFQEYPLAVFQNLGSIGAFLTSHYKGSMQEMWQLNELMHRSKELPIEMIQPCIEKLQIDFASYMRYINKDPEILFRYWADNLRFAAANFLLPDEYGFHGYLPSGSPDAITLMQMLDSYIKH